MRLGNMEAVNFAINYTKENGFPKRRSANTVIRNQKSQFRIWPKILNRRQKSTE